MRGKFIVLDGGEGAGKSTVAGFLKTKLPNERFLFTREPGGTPLAEKIRAVIISPEDSEASAETQFGLIWAARFDHVQKKIIPALKERKTVISERFDSSTYAYQIYGQEAPHLKPLFRTYRKLLGEYVPDLYILLDVAPKEGLARMRRRNRKKGESLDSFEKRELAFHERVRAGLLEFVKAVPSVTVDANRPLSDVQKEVLDVLRHAIADKSFHFTLLK